MEKHLFEIGIYNQSFEQFHASIEKKVQRYMDDFPGRGGITREQAPKVFDEIKNRASGRYPQWRYNQIIGWLQIYVLGSQVRGEYWFTEKKRIPFIVQNPALVYQGKAFELSFYPEDSSNDIFAGVCARIDMMNKERPFKGRFIDTESFHNTGPAVNWRHLLGYETEI